MAKHSDDEPGRREVQLPDAPVEGAVVDLDDEDPDVVVGVIGRLDAQHRRAACDRPAPRDRTIVPVAGATAHRLGAMGLLRPDRAVCDDGRSALPPPGSPGAR